MTKQWLFVGKDESMDGAWEVQVEALTVQEGARWGEEEWATVCVGAPSVHSLQAVTPTPCDHTEISDLQLFRPT